MRDLKYDTNTSTDFKIAAAHFIKEREYWKKRLSGEWEKSHFPWDFRRKEKTQPHVDSESFTISGEVFSRLMKITKGSDPMIHMVLSAGVAALLAKYTNQQDIIIGTSVDRQDTQVGLVNTVLPLRIQLKNPMTFKELLSEVKSTIKEAIENQNYPIETLATEMNLTFSANEFPLFDVAVILENIQDKGYIRHTHPTITYSFLRTENLLEGVVEYDALLYENATIERLIKHYILLLEKALIDVNIKLEEIELLLEEEKKQLFQFNDTTAQYPQDKTLHELFSEQVEKTPENTAVLHGDRKLTYRELNERSNRFARILRENGVKPGALVGILAETSPAVVMAILGVLKAGAAYLPIEPRYPRARKRFLLEDSKAVLLLTQRALENSGKQGPPEWEGRKAYIEDIDVNQGNASNLENIAVPSDPVYVIYTSGTTGKPKGVLIEHKGLINYIWWAARNYVKKETVNFPLYTSISFDLTVTSLFTPLISGNAVVIYSGEYGELLIPKIVQDNQVGVVKLTPSHLQQLKDKDIEESNIKRFILGGEMLTTSISREIYDNFHGNIEIYNEYGPTEATVGCMIYQYDPRDNDNRQSVPIGTPAANTQIHLLDKNLNPVPIGAVGEIYIAGDGITRGYLNRPELTAEKFCLRRPGGSFCKNRPLDPHKNFLLKSTHSPIYQTGDLGRWLPDGNIVFLGRIDYQVKIKGFRIELGEIEKHLSKHKNIKQSVVVAWEDQHQIRFICAYIVSQEKLAVSELREYLSNELPEYMIPTYFIQVEEIPLTAQGKVDKKMLPEPGSDIDTGVQYKAPRDQIEKLLVKIWEEVLGVNNIGIEDDYFNLGGDSIKAIQLAARLQKHQLKLETRYLFQYPTIAALTGYIKEVKQTAPQEIVTGEVKLTPIQEWFFRKKGPELNHFNQAVLLHRPEGFKEEILKKVFNEFLEHHDALRLVFERDANGRVRQFNQGMADQLLELKTWNLQEKKESGTIIEETCNQMQSSIDLCKGPMIKTGLFKTNKGDYLAIVIHHLAIDGVSWRILFEDLTTAYQQVEKGEEPLLPLKSTSFKEWAEKLHDYSNRKELLEELKYWKKFQEVQLQPLPVDNLITERKIADKGCLSMELFEEYTKKLLKDCNKAYNTEINDLLLAALGLAFKQWAGMDKVLVAMEGHGREEIIDNVDITRTIGWFTSLFPVIIEVEQESDIGSVIKNIKEMSRKIPNKGIGYGILKYLTPKQSKLEISFELEPSICFNYLGQFDQDIKSEVFQIADISPGHSIDLNSPMDYSLEIEAVIYEGRLKLSVNYCMKEFNETKIAQLVYKYIENLKQIIDHCAGKEETELTASDLSSADFCEEEMDAVFNELQEAFMIGG